MPAKKANASKKKLAPAKKAEDVKPLKNFSFTKPVDKGSPVIH